MFEKLKSYYNLFKIWGYKHRLYVFVIAALVFVAGLALSISKLNLSAEDIKLAPVFYILFIFAPVLALLNGYELSLCAKALSRDMKFRDSLTISTGATLANILPLPAGLLMRGGALIKTGASLKDTSRILLLAGLLWMSMAATISIIAITTNTFQTLLGTAGVIATASVLTMIYRFSSAKIAIGFFLIRAAMIGILTAQLKMAFAIFDVSIKFHEAAIYVVSGISAAVVSIVPGGLGLTEGTGAVLAKIAGAEPEAAFLALSLNRILSLCVIAILAAILVWSRKNAHTPVEET